MRTAADNEIKHEAVMFSTEDTAIGVPIPASWEPSGT